jgi:flagellar basal-body rod protein FlgF
MLFGGLFHIGAERNSGIAVMKHAGGTNHENTRLSRWPDDCIPGKQERAMDSMSAAVASGMRSRIEALDVLANNIANANTPGFKADREFYNLYSSPDASQTDALPVVERNWTDFSAGTLESTGNPLDLAIDGSGFFAVSGPSAEVLYTRNGNFRIGSNGELETQNGFKVRGAGGNAIKLDPRREVSVSADGSVVQDGATITRLQVVDVPSTSALEKTGSTYFRLTHVDALVRQATANIQQGRLEMANGASAEHAVRLVTIMRQFEMLQKALSISADMGKKSIEEVARVSG